MIVLEGQTGESLECFLYLFIVPELCLLADVQGGFEVDAPVKVKQAVPVGASPGKTSSKLQKGTNNIGLTGMCLLIISEPLDISERQRECLPVLNTHYCYSWLTVMVKTCTAAGTFKVYITSLFFILVDLEELQGQFKVLSKLPASTRSSFFQQISVLLQNRAAISVLENAVSEHSRNTWKLTAYCKEFSASIPYTLFTFSQMLHVTATPKNMFVYCYCACYKTCGLSGS